MDDRLGQLIEEAKRTGPITYDRFSEIFPEDSTTPDRIDQIFSALEAHGVELQDGDDSEDLGLGDNDPTGSQETIDDPVRLYLSQMGEIHSSVARRSFSSPRRSKPLAIDSVRSSSGAVSCSMRSST